ncbi:MAG TPA: glycosyl hydrolase [Kiritimatiellia bacterium]|nr:glycosyl hydrolase [Kiritimatiellia bacterium]HRU70514.1 glycosyl hydrolase [Kiritimatiellia bacterium]
MKLPVTIMMIALAALCFASPVTEEVYAKLGKKYDARTDPPFAPGTERFVAWRDPAKAERSDRTEGLFRQLRDIRRKGRFVYSWTHPWPEAAQEFRVMTENGPVPKAPDDSDFVGGFARKFGCNPVMYFTDFYFVTGTWQTPERYAETRASLLGMIRKAWRMYQAVPVFSWHVENPYVPAGWRDVKYGDAPYRYRYASPGYPAEHARVIREILSGQGKTCGSGRSNGTTGTPYATPRAWYDARLDDIASFLKELKDEEAKPIPAVVRLFHECEVDWHWWGGKSALTREYIMLFRYTVNRLRESAGGGRDLLFAYSTDRYWKTATSADGAGDFLYRYPGDDVVDIVGFDDYSIGTGNDDEVAKRLASTIEKMKMVSAFAVAHGKASGLFETGVRGARDDAYDWIFAAMTAPGVAFGFVNTWGGGYTMPETEAGIACWKRFLARPEVVTYGADVRLVP